MTVSDKLAKLGAGIFRPIFAMAVKDDFITDLFCPRLSKVTSLEAGNRQILKELVSANKRLDV